VIRPENRAPLGSTTALFTVTGSTTIVFADYGMSRPQSFMVLSIADHGIMEFQLQFTKG